MSKKIGGFVALAGLCALSLILLNCGSSSSRPSGVLYVLTEGGTGIGNVISSYSVDLNSGELSDVYKRQGQVRASNRKEGGLEVEIRIPAAAGFALPAHS